MKIRIGHPFLILMYPYLLEGINWFKHLFMNFELLDFLMQHQEFIPNCLNDLDDMLHCDRVRRIELYIRLKKSGGFINYEAKSNNIR